MKIFFYKIKNDNDGNLHLQRKWMKKPRNKLTPITIQYLMIELSAVVNVMVY